MKITVVCAAGRQGALLVKEAALRGHEVTAVARKGDRVPAEAKAVIEKDLFDLTWDDLKDSDVVIDAFGTWAENTLSQHSTSLKRLCDILSGTEIRLLVVGGAGSLYTNPEHTAVLSDSPSFPSAFLPLAKAQGKALEELRRRNDVRWTFLSPAADFQAEGKRTGKYLLGGEEMICNTKGECAISYADYAVAMLDEAENAAHVQQRFSVVAE